MKPCYRELVALRNDAPPHAPVFRSRGGAYGKSSSSLDPSQVARIVEAAACRAVIAVHTETIIVDGKQVQRKRSLVSHHWMRHAHASHALDNKEDKEMKPSEEFDDYWIRAQNEHMDYPASDDWRSGKWLVFCRKGETLDAMWETVTAHAPNPYEDAIPIPPPPPHLTKKPRRYLGVLLIIAILLFSASAGVFFLARSLTVDRAKPGCHNESCVTAHSRKAQKPGLD